MLQQAATLAAATAFDERREIVVQYPALGVNVPEIQFIYDFSDLRTAQPAVIIIMSDAHIYSESQKLRGDALLFVCSVVEDDVKSAVHARNEAKQKWATNPNNLLR